MIFESVDGASMNPGMEFQFSDELLVNNFKLIVGD
jgi:signal peptidase I